MSASRVAALALAVVALSCAGPRPASDAAPPDPRLSGSYRFERNGWIYVHAEGSPDRLGFQHGYLLAPEIDDLLRVVKPALLQFTKKDWAFYRKAAAEMLWPKIDLEYQQETRRHRGRCPRAWRRRRSR